MAAPFKLTAAGRRRLLDAIAAGNTRKVAAIHAGIGRSTLLRYLQIGRKQKRGKMRDLWDAVKKAENVAVVRNVGLISTAADKNWTAAAWWLERRHPDDWAKKDKHEVTGRNGGPVVIQITEEAVSADGGPQDGPAAPGPTELPA